MNGKRLQNNRLNKNINILIPAIVFFVINTIVQFLQQVRSLDFFTLFGFLISLTVFSLITQTLAYLTCRFLVIKRNKGQREVWINYIIWILVMNLGIVSELFSK